ncbi:L-lactate permease [Streptomyces sp. NPDC018964]|uniref:L-lactate permease n=1 Tax=unclassified Streptomyces TaxID=2593676 RepID=UPI0037988B72
MRTVLAAAPPVLALLLLLSRRLRPASAAGAVLVLSVITAAAAFGSSPAVLARGYKDIAPTVVEVVLILLGGTLLNRQLAAAGAHAVIAEWIRTFSTDRARSVLLIGLGVTPFAESVTGFGIGIVVAIPLLVGLGFGRLQAATMGLLGLVVVPWGALAPGTLVAGELTGVDVDRLGTASALLSLPVLVLCGLAGLVTGCGRRTALRRLPELLWVSGMLWAGLLAAQAVAGTALAGALGSLVGVFAAVTLIRWREGAWPRFGREIRTVLTPYGLLLAGLLGARSLLAVLGLPTGAVASVLGSPALWLLVTCAAVPRLLGGAAGGGQPLVAAVNQWWPVALTTALFLLAGSTLTVSGMSAELARAAAQLGQPYMAVAPWIGGLGGFLTGSNTGANAMFAAGQAEAAHVLDHSAVTLVAVQNVSGSLLTMAAVPRVVLALELASGERGERGEDGPRPEQTERRLLLRRILGIDAAVLSVLSVIALAA